METRLPVLEDKEMTNTGWFRKVNLLARLRVKTASHLSRVSVSPQKDSVVQVLSSWMGASHTC